jgi:hypothetical protein
MSEIKGSCRCGKVTYVSSATPVFIGVCHCRTCQKSTGTAYASVLAVPAASVSISGTTTRFDDIGESGKATHRDFCPTCGTTITQSADLMEGITMVTVGTLEDPTWAQPGMQIYCDSALPWAKISDVQGFPKMPMPS